MNPRADLPETQLFPAKYPHEARFLCTDDWGAGGVSVYAKTAIRIVHTHAHTHTRVDGRGADTHRWGGGCFSLSPGSVLEAASLKKV